MEPATIRLAVRSVVLDRRGFRLQLVLTDLASRVVPSAVPDTLLSGHVPLALVGGLRIAIDPPRMTQHTAATTAPCALSDIAFSSLVVRSLPAPHAPHDGLLEHRHRRMEELEAT
jgi:hypothetical protein